VAVASIVTAQLRADVDDLARQRARPGVKNWFTFCERAAPGGGVAYDDYSSGVVEWALNATPGVWAPVIGREGNGGEAGVDVGLQRMLTTVKRGGAAGLVLHEPGHFVAIRSADLALLAELAEPAGQEPALGDRHRFHIIDSMQRGETAGLTATQVVELVRDRLRNNHDVIVVGRDDEADVATGSAPKHARPNGGSGGEGGGVRPAGAAGGSGDAGASGAAAARSGAAGEAAVGAAGGGGSVVGAAVPLSVEHERSVSAAPSISHLNRVRNRNRYGGRAQAAPPAPLGAARPRAEAGESAMDVADGGEAAQQGGAPAKRRRGGADGDGGVGLEGSTVGAVGLGRGAAEAAAEGSTDTAAGSAEEVEMEVADSADTTTTTTTTRRRKRPKRPGKKQGGKLRNAGKFRAQRRDHDDGDGGGRAFRRLLHPSSAGGQRGRLNLPNHCTRLLHRTKNQVGAGILPMGTH